MLEILLQKWVVLWKSFWKLIYPALRNNSQAKLKLTFSDESEIEVFVNYSRNELREELPVYRFVRLKRLPFVNLVWVTRRGKGIPPEDRQLIFLLVFTLTLWGLIFYVS